MLRTKFLSSSEHAVYSSLRGLNLSKPLILKIADKIDSYVVSICGAGWLEGIQYLKAIAEIVDPWLFMNQGAKTNNLKLIRHALQSPNWINFAIAASRIAAGDGSLHALKFLLETLAREIYSIAREIERCTTYAVALGQLRSLVLLRKIQQNFARSMDMTNFLFDLNIEAARMVNIKVVKFIEKWLSDFKVRANFDAALRSAAESTIAWRKTRKLIIYLKSKLRHEHEDIRRVLNMALTDAAFAENLRAMKLLYKLGADNTTGFEYSMPGASQELLRKLVHY